MAAQTLVQKYEQEASEYRNLDKELAKLQSKRSQYLTQLNENEMVKKELDILEDDANVYKLIGPVLVKQEKTESQSNVNKRVEFISGELKRLEATYKDTEKKANDKKSRVLELQAAIQQAQARQGQPQLQAAPK